MPNLTLNLADLIDDDYDPRRTKVWIEANSEVLADTNGHKLRFGDAKVTISDDGTGEFTNLLATNAPGIIPATGRLYQVWVDYALRHSGERRRWRSGWFPLTADDDLSTVEITVEITVFDTTVITTFSGLLADAEAARDAAAASAQYAGSASGLWVIDPADPDVLEVTPSAQVSVDPSDADALVVTI